MRKMRVKHIFSLEWHEIPFLCVLLSPQLTFSLSQMDKQKAEQDGKYTDKEDL